MKLKVGQKIRLKSYDEIMDLNKIAEKAMDDVWKDFFFNNQGKFFEIKRITDKKIYPFNESEFDKFCGIKKRDIYFYHYEVKNLNLINIKDSYFEI